MRLASAMLAAFTVAFVFATVRELAPGRPWAPVAAAMLAAFQPVFGFIEGHRERGRGSEPGWRRRSSSC